MTIHLQTDLNYFYHWVLWVKLNFSKSFEIPCHVIFLESFTPSPRHHTISLNGFLLEWIHLGFYLTPTLSFNHHINKTVNKALIVLDYLKRNINYQIIFIQFYLLNSLVLLLFSLVTMV